MSAFSPARPATWTWDTLNAWLMAPARTPGEVRRALGAEQRFSPRGRLAYQLRLQARLNRLEGEAAKRRLIDGGKR